MRLAIVQPASLEDLGPDASKTKVQPLLSRLPVVLLGVPHPALGPHISLQCSHAPLGTHGCPAPAG